MLRRALDAGEYYAAAVIFQQQHLIRRESVPDFHTRVAERHAGYRKSDGISWGICQEFLDVTSGDMPLEDITLRRHGGMARLVARRDLISNLDGIQIRRVLSGSITALFFKVRCPFFATTTTAALVNGEFSYSM